MPLTTISLRRGKSAEYRKAIFESLHLAMHETFNVPADNGFMTIIELDEENFKYSKSYLGVERSDDIVMMQLTVNNTRTLEQKKALYQKIVERLGVSPGIRPEDVFINLIEVLPENWSLGNGLAQYAPK